VEHWAVRRHNGSVMRLFIIFAACALCFAKDTAKPQCGSRNQGEFWPDAANTDRELRSKLNHCGQLEICTYQVWRYKWKPVSVHVSQLGKTPQPVSAECSAVMDEATKKASASAEAPRN